MAEPAPAIRLKVPRLELGGRVIFDRLELELEAGRTTCLLGTSGIGKSSLLRLVAGLLPGAVVEPELHGRTALMAQSDLLLPWLSVLDNALLGYRLRGTLRRDRPTLVARARGLLDDLGLAGREADLPAALSGGMRQRVALARTLLEDRPVVLMDEPFSALDAVTRHRLQDLAARLLDGRTVLLVTHSPQEALRLGHVVHVLEGSPARCHAALRPAGPTPRDIADRRLIVLQAQLMQRLMGTVPAAELAA